MECDGLGWGVVEAGVDEGGEEGEGVQDCVCYCRYLGGGKRVWEHGKWQGGRAVKNRHAQIRGQALRRQTIC
jgi:hypothetical protein